MIVDEETRKYVLKRSSYLKTCHVAKGEDLARAGLMVDGKLFGDMMNHIEWLERFFMEVVNLDEEDHVD